MRTMIMTAGIETIAHFTMKITIDKNGILMSLTTISFVLVGFPKFSASLLYQDSGLRPGTICIILKQNLQIMI